MSHKGICLKRLLDDFLRSLDGLEYKPVIVFGGFGEPLYHPKILEMIERAKGAAQRVELITNGLLLSEQMAREFIRIGLDMVWFSVDRLHTDVYGNGAIFLPNIEMLNVLRISQNSRLLPETGIVFVATRSNMEELPVLLRGASRYGVTRYMVTNVLPYTAEMCDQALYSRTLDEVGSRPSLWSPIVQLPRIDLNEVTLLPLYKAMRARHNVSVNNICLNPSGGRCPFIDAGTVAISWDGAVSPCLALMHSHNSFLYDKPRAVRRYVVGNVNNALLTEIWCDTEHIAFRKRVQGFDFSPCTLCGGCDMAEANEEDCFGNGFPTCGGCLWAWGVIQCP